jgi:hypothetical protein
MPNTILTILQCCDSIRELNEEFQKPWGWLKIKEKRECKKLKSKLIPMIDGLLDDQWNIEYLVNLERILLIYWDKLENYIEDISISKDRTFTQSLNRFIPIYFSDVDNGKIYILDIKGNTNITFNIISLKTGKSLEIIGGGYTNSSQKKVEMQCKQKIINMLKNYLEDISVDKVISKDNLMKN